MSVAELQLLTIEEVATALKQSVSTIRQKVYRGELEAVRLGQFGPLRIPAAALGEHLRAGRTNVAATADDAATPRDSRGSRETA